MNVLIVGLGSMGQRRLRLIQNKYPDYVISGIEFSKERRDDVEKIYNIKTYESTVAALQEKKFDTAFVCTPPATHYKVIKELLDNKINVFTEINLLNKGYDELLQLAKKNDVQIFMSSTPLYRKEIQKICELVSKQTKPLQYIYHVGQYLPDWHPWESYKKFFVGNSETNGCREIFAIQMPWLLKCFGNDAEILSTSRKQITNLEIEYPDSYIVTIEHKTGNRGVLIIDVAARKATTYLEIVGEDTHIKWDGTPNGLSVYNFDRKEFDAVSLYESFEHNEKYAANIIEDAYLAEIECFFGMLKGTVTPLYFLEDDANTLRLIDIIEGKTA